MDNPGRSWSMRQGHSGIVKPSDEWQRCGEGFDSVKPSSMKAGQHRKKSGASRHRFGLGHLRDEYEEISQEIAWSSSDSDEDRKQTVKAPLDISSKKSPEKVFTGKRLQSPVYKRPSKKPRRSLPKPQFTLASQHSGEVNIDSSESDGEERDGTINLGKDRKSDIEENACQDLKQKEQREPAIQPFDSDEDSEKLLSQSKLGSASSPDISTTPSTSSVASSQSGGKVRASEWLKTLHLKTPSKESAGTDVPETDDSAKKKRKRYIKNGLAEQLSRLQVRERSAVRMWSHQQVFKQTESQGSTETLTLKVLEFEVLYSIQLAICEVLTSTDSEELQNKERRLVLFSAQTMDQLNIQTGSVVKVHPPWQHLELSSAGETVLLCTHYTRLLEQVESMEDLEPSKQKNKIAAKWNCPCVAGLSRSHDVCPAYKFPPVPGILATQDSTDKKEVPVKSLEAQSPCPGTSALHTVTKSMPTETATDSVLEGIEKSSGGLSGTLAFRGRLHRVSSPDRTHSRKLLVEDGHGTMCEIQISETVLCDTALPSNLDDLEGQSCRFMGLRVHSRATRDRDLLLFGLIDAVWSGCVTSAVSQNSEDSIGLSQGEKGIGSLNPPSFCYILWPVEGCIPDLLVQSCSSCVAQFKEIPHIQLAKLHQKTYSIYSRITCMARVLCIHKKAQVTESGACSGTCAGKQIVYMLDPSLSRDSPGYSRLYTSTLVEKWEEWIKQNSLVFLFRDLSVQKDYLTTDCYSKVSPVTSDTPWCPEATLQNFLGLKVSLADVDENTPEDSLCQISGIITGVDESTAYSWDVCRYCGNDQLVTNPSNNPSFRCQGCSRNVSNPVTKMKMEVYVHCPNMGACKLKVDLQQKTIERLLPQDQEADEGYELSCVLNKAVGPLACIVLHTKTDKKLKTREKYAQEITLLG